MSNKRNSLENCLLVFSFTCSWKKFTYSISNRGEEDLRPMIRRSLLAAPPTPMPGGLKRWSEGGGHGAASWLDFGTKLLTWPVQPPAGKHPIPMAHSLASGPWIGIQSHQNVPLAVAGPVSSIQFYPVGAFKWSTGIRKKLEKWPLSFSELRQ